MNNLCLCPNCGRNHAFDGYNALPICNMLQPQQCYCEMHGHHTDYHGHFAEAMRTNRIIPPRNDMPTVDPYPGAVLPPPQPHRDHRSHSDRARRDVEGIHHPGAEHARSASTTAVPTPAPISSTPRAIARSDSIVVPAYATGTASNTARVPSAGAVSDTIVSDAPVQVAIAQLVLRFLNHQEQRQHEALERQHQRNYQLNLALIEATDRQRAREHELRMAAVRSMNQTNPGRSFRVDATNRSLPEAMALAADFNENRIMRVVWMVAGTVNAAPEPSFWDMESPIGRRGSLQAFGQLPLNTLNPGVSGTGTNVHMAVPAPAPAPTTVSNAFPPSNKETGKSQSNNENEDTDQ